MNDEAPPPRVLSSDPNSDDYHPSCLRVGLRIDGEERRDVMMYDCGTRIYMTTDKEAHMAQRSIEPYWRHVESRQQRRARERWEGKHK